MSDLRIDTQVLTLNTEGFQQALLDSAVSALREGAVLELVDGVRTYHVSEMYRFSAKGNLARIEVLERDIADLQRRYSRARTNASDVEDEDPDVASDFRADALAHKRTIRTRKAEIDALRDTEEVVKIEPFSAEGTYIARALSNLAVLPHSVHYSVAEAFARIITNVRLVEITGRTATFEWWLRLPITGGTARLGPIRFTVNHKTPRSRLAPSAISRLLDTLGHEGTYADHTIERLRVLGRHELELRGIGPLAAKTLSMCPITEVIDIFIDRLTDKKVKPFNAGFRRLIEDTYLDPAYTWMTSFYAADCYTRQLVMDTIGAAGGTMAAEELGEALAARVPPGSPLVQHYTVLRDQRRPSGRVLPASVVNDTDHRVLKTSRLSLVTCRHCGSSVDFAVNVPEISDMMLCTSCWKMPRVADSPVFPKSYEMLRARTP